MRIYYMGVRKVPRFEVEDVVEYDRGEVADKLGLPRIVRATIRVIHPVATDTLYTITYGNLGIATVREQELSWAFEPLGPDGPTSQYQDSVDSAEVR